MVALIVLPSQETKEERRRRKQREYTALYRTRHPEKVVAAQALKTAARAANLEEARRNDREAKRRAYHANPEKARAKAKEKAPKYRDAQKAYLEVWRKENPELVAQYRASAMQKRKENWDEFLAKLRAKYHRDPSKTLERQRLARFDPAFLPKQRAYNCEYRKRHPELAALRYAARKAAKLKATPHWCDLEAVAEIYRQAAQLSIDTGTPYEVDHIVPLRSKLVCGLHIPINLQILTRTENRRKHTKIIHVEAGEPHRAGLHATTPVRPVPPTQATLGLHSGASESRQKCRVHHGPHRRRPEVQEDRRQVLICWPDLHSDEGHHLDVPEAFHGGHPRD